MKKFLLSIAAIAVVAVSSFAHADDTWVGNVKVRLQHRGLDNTTAFNGQPIPYNLADYNTYNVYFEYFQQGVTDNSGVAVWQQVNAQAQTVKDSTGEVIGTASIPVVGTDGNNVVYNIYLPTINPMTVSTLDPEMQNRGTMHAHLNVTLNGVQVLSLPVDYSYSP
jgi:hypothetical protein